MNSIVTTRHWKGYAFGNPWEAKATELYTTVGTLYQAANSGLLKVVRSEKSENGFVYGTWHSFYDSEGLLVSFYNDHYFMLQDERVINVHRDLKPIQND